MTVTAPPPAHPAPWEVHDPTTVLTIAGEAVSSRRDAELCELWSCLSWADMFGADPREEPGHVPVAGGERLVHLGGEGTPEVRELSLVELGVALCRHPLAVRAMTADVLDLRHRLPRTWAAVMDLRCDAWVARKVAAMSRAVPLATIAQVDAAVAGAIIGVAVSRVLDIAEAAVICADPGGHRARLAAERARRFVSLGRHDDTGLRTLVARLTSGDAIYLDAMVHRVADILAVRRAADALPELERDHLRSEALGWLARPAELLALLLEHGQDLEDLGEPADHHDQPAQSFGEATRRQRHPDVEPVGDEPAQPEHDTTVPSAVPDPGPRDEHPVEPDHSDPAAEPDDETPSRPFAVPADVLAALTPEILQHLRPTATLYVHLHESALAPVDPADDAHGVARVEGHGPLDISLIGDLLGHHRVRVAPVIDNREHYAVDAYEHPAWMRERIHLRSPADASPHASRVSRRLDLDHPRGYDPDGPPGQTTTDSQPLSRTVHRARTHLGYTVTPTPSGVVWRTPHGLYRLVDTTGRTHLLSADDAAVLIHGQTALDAALDAALRRFLESSAEDQPPKVSSTSSTSRTLSVSHATYRSADRSTTPRAPLGTSDPKEP